MATVTTNYGFDIPQSSDLVKDGATAIATLGQDIDTAMNTALGTKKAGMVLLNTTSFSGVASQSINDVFSTTYDRYAIKLNMTASSSLNLFMRLRVSGADNSSANYRSQYVRGLAGTPGSARTTGDTSWQVGVVDTVNSYLDMEILNPFQTAITSGRSEFASSTSGDIDNYLWKHGISVTTSYTGFTFFPSSGSVTGSVSVYGYNK